MGVCSIFLEQQLVSPLFHRGSERGHMTCIDFGKFASYIRDRVNQMDQNANEL